MTSLYLEIPFLCTIRKLICECRLKYQIKKLNKNFRQKLKAKINVKIVKMFFNNIFYSVWLDRYFQKFV